MIKRLQQGVLVYCDHCEAYFGPMEYPARIDDAAICTMLDGSGWRTGYGPSVGIETRRVQYCPNCVKLPACRMCATVAREGEPYCSDHCYREWRFAHD